MKQYNGRLVVIVGEAGCGHSEQDAHAFATERYEPGTFTIQNVTPGSDRYTQTFHSRVAI